MEAKNLITKTGFSHEGSRTCYMPGFAKYRPGPPVPLENRQWPNHVITKAPIWASSDLRDGNQSLEVPMSLEQKLRFFEFLVSMGFKTIEIAFPAASDTEFKLTRTLIENDLIPDDVAIQVLTQSREHIIARTFEALKGAKNAIIHLYNSTSALQRDVVFGFSRQQCIDLAVQGARMIKDYIDRDTSGTNWMLEYSPESFSGTEPDFAVEICDAVLDVWQPTEERKAIINLPNTVEMATPNHYADQVEYFCTHTRWRPQILVSLHPHNDRGTATAAAELGLLAGADRIEGTLFGNGERTGNADILNIAMNLYVQGIDPGLDFSDMNAVVEVYEDCTHMMVPPRHPDAGRLVFTSFSGSHQDAIKKGMARQAEHPERWEVPYLPLDPADVGRSYEPIIRINSQSGKGGVAYILEHRNGLMLPKEVAAEFSKICTRISDSQHRELLPHEIFTLFKQEYINITQPLCLKSYQEEVLGMDQAAVVAVLDTPQGERTIRGRGIGLLDAFLDAVHAIVDEKLEIVLYSQHAMTRGTKSMAMAYVQVKGTDGRITTGCGLSSNVSKSSLRAVVSAVNKRQAEPAPRSRQAEPAPRSR